MKRKMLKNLYKFSDNVILESIRDWIASTEREGINSYILVDTSAFTHPGDYRRKELAIQQLLSEGYKLEPGSSTSSRNIYFSEILRISW